MQGQQVHAKLAKEQSDRVAVIVKAVVYIVTSKYTIVIVYLLHVS